MLFSYIFRPAKIVFFFTPYSLRMLNIRRVMDF